MPGESENSRDRQRFDQFLHGLEELARLGPHFCLMAIDGAPMLAPIAQADARDFDVILRAGLAEHLMNIAGALAVALPVRLLPLND